MSGQTRDGLDDSDELDVLVRGAAPVPPRGLAPCVLRRAAFEQHRGRWVALLILDAAAVLMLGLLVAGLARAVVAGDAGELLRLGIQDQGLVRAYPAAYLQALVVALPWPRLALLTLDALTVVLLSRRLLRAVPPTAARATAATGNSG